jgi:hypothetical protein
VNGEGYADSVRAMFGEKWADEAISGYPVSELSPSPREQAEGEMLGYM